MYPEPIKDAETREIYNIVNMFGSIPDDKHDSILRNMNLEQWSVGGIMSIMRSTLSSRSKIPCWIPKLKQAYTIIKQHNDDPDEILKGLTQFLSSPKKNTILVKMFKTLITTNQFDAIDLVSYRLDWWNLSVGEIYHTINILHPHKDKLPSWNSILSMGTRALDRLGQPGSKILSNYSEV